MRPNLSVGFEANQPARMQNQKNPVRRSCFFFLASAASSHEVRKDCTARRLISFRSLYPLSLTPREKLPPEEDIRLVEGGVGEFACFSVGQVLRHGLRDRDRPGFYRDWGSASAASSKYRAVTTALSQLRFEAMPGIRPFNNAFSPHGTSASFPVPIGGR